MKKIIFACFCFLLPLKAFSFLNIEALRQNTEPGFKGNTALRMSGALGNTERIVGNFQTMNAYRTDKRETLMLLSYEYGSSFRIKNSNKGSFHLRESRTLTHRFSVEGFGQIQFDEFKRLRSRKLLGAGLRTKIFQDTSHSIFLGSGGFYEWESLKELPNENVTRGNFYLSYLYKSDENSRLGGSVIVYFQPSLKALEDNRFIVDAGLQFRLTRTLSYIANLGVARDTRPPPSVKRTDWTYLTGLSWAY